MDSRDNENTDVLNTQRLANAVEALTAYMEDVATPIISGDSAQEIVKLKKDNEKLRDCNQQAKDQLDGLIHNINQKGLQS